MRFKKPDHDAWIRMFLTAFTMMFSFGCVLCSGIEDAFVVNTALRSAILTGITLSVNMAIEHKNLN